jgi:beta-lactamase regulating signal transducer with metallopeptidase domain
MITEPTMNPPRRRRSHTGAIIRAAVAIGILGGGGTWVVSSVQKARNAARSASTT